MRLKAVFVAVMRHFREEFMWRSAYHRLDERAQAIAPTLPVIASDLALYVPQDGNLNSLGVLVLTPRELAFARPHPEAYRDTQAFTRRHVFPLEEP